MSVERKPDPFPVYLSFVDTIGVLELAVSASELHGVMCAYLCAGAFQEGELYLRALLVRKQKNSQLQAAVLASFELYELSKHYINQPDFEFRLLMPDDDTPLIERARAFGEWCKGFIEGLELAGVGYHELEEDDSQEALQHLHEFAGLDYLTLDVDEEDEKSLMEVSEYTRMAVLRLSGDIKAHGKGRVGSDTAH